MSGSWADAAALVAVHRPGSTWLHRLPAGAKVAGLVVAFPLLLRLDTPYAAAAGLAVSIAVLSCARVPWRSLGRVVRAVAVVVLVLAAFQAWAVGWGAAAVGVCRLLSCLALAWAVSLTTPVLAMLDLLHRLLRPLRPLGVDPERAAMSLTLAIRAIPLVLTAAARADEARRARSARLSVRALVVPTVVRSHRIADGLGEGLLARGYPPEDD